MAHCYAVRMAAGTSADGNDSADPFREQHTSRQAQHAAHAGAHTSVELLDSEVIEQSKLGTFHIFHGEDGEPGRISLAICRVDGRRTGRSIAAADDIGADDEVFVRVQRLSRAYKLLPPARLRIGLCTVGMAGSRQTRVQQHSIALVGIECSPSLIGYIKLWYYSTPVQQQRVLAQEVLVVASSIRRFWTKQRALLQARGSALQGIEAGKG